MNKKLHFVGIGGIGMSGIARILYKMGVNISGSDIKSTEISYYLEQLGITIFYSHKASHIHKDIDAVIYSNAIDLNNPEIRQAHKMNIPTISRAEMLAEILRLKRAIGISGTHGKTTTSSMIGHILRYANLDPTLIIGGIIFQVDNNAYLGQGDFIVYEACEAFGSIDYLGGEIICITNIDDDHMEYYNSMDNLLSSFLNYINRIPFYGLAILNGDDSNIQKLLPLVRKKYLLFGFDTHNDLYATHLIQNGFSTSFEVIYHQKNLGTFLINSPGKHNILNALAAIAMGIATDVSLDLIKKSLAQFQNPERRFQYHGKYKNAFIIEDYAHHPTEIAATIQTSLDLKKNNAIHRVVVAFQPHLFSRTEMHHINFAKELQKADFVVLAPIYKAREKNTHNIDLSIITNIFDDQGYKNYFVASNLTETKKYLKKIIQKEDLVLIMGAGDINNIIDSFIKKEEPLALCQ